MMEPMEVLLRAAAAISAAGACGSLYKFVKSVSRNRMIADASLVNMRSAAQGYVKVTGRVKAGTEPVIAPLSHRSCVWWSYELAERKGDDKSSWWACIDRATSITPFILADEDGECWVGPVNAEITPTLDDKWYGYGPRPGRGPTVLGITAKDACFRYTERLLCVGDELSVVGELRSHSEIQKVNNHSVKLLHEWKRNPTYLLQRFDSNSDGKIDAGEWETARLTAAKEAHVEMLKAPVARMSVIGEPTDDKPFMIAPLDSESLVRREKLRAVMYLGLGVACTLICAGSLMAIV